MSSKLLIRGARVVDPQSALDRVADIMIAEGRISRVGSSLPPEDAEILDASGLVAVPGLIDMHVHLREPGFEYKETIASGTAAAVAGGFTAVASMANTSPPNDCAAVTEYILRRAAHSAKARVYPIGATTKGMEGKELAEMGEMVAAGAVAVSDDGLPVLNPNVMRRAMEYSTLFGIAVIEHCETPALHPSGVMNEGYWSTTLGLHGIPRASEEIAVRRNIVLAELTGARFHVAHLSTKAALRAVREAKERGLPVSCEVTPHHLLLTDERVASYDTGAKMKPPLVTEEDRLALIQGIADGTVDAIATDHAPHHRDEKAEDFDQAPFGIVGLETAAALVHRSSRQARAHFAHPARRAPLFGASSHPEGRGRLARRRCARRRHPPRPGPRLSHRPRKIRLPRQEHAFRGVGARGPSCRHDCRGTPCVRTGMSARERRIAVERAVLEELRRRYQVGYLDTDPIALPRRFAEPRDREVTALVASALAYGNVKAIQRSLERLTPWMGESPAGLARHLEVRDSLDALEGFRHRWTGARDVVCLLGFIGQMLESSGSVGGFFLETYEPGDIGQSLLEFRRRALGLDHGGAYRSKGLPPDAGVRFFFSSPRTGACKRMNMFLRWMVRRDDGVDLGLWPEVAARDLVVPLDTHIYRIGRHLGWTCRKTPGFATAVDITRRLALLDSEDPVKYDFALSRMGMLRDCPRHRRDADCELCALRRRLRKPRAKAA